MNKTLADLVAPESSFYEAAALRSWPPIKAAHLVPATSGIAQSLIFLRQRFDPIEQILLARHAGDLIA